MSRSSDATLITSARKGASLDVEERQRRYLITMGLRTACFIAFLSVPGWWKVACLIGAAVLPAVGVLLANNADHHTPATVADDENPSPRTAIAPGPVVRGTVENEETDHP